MYRGGGGVSTTSLGNIPKKKHFFGCFPNQIHQYKMTKVSLKYTCVATQTKYVFRGAVTTTELSFSVMPAHVPPEDNNREVQLLLAKPLSPLF